MKIRFAVINDNTDSFLVKFLEKNRFVFSKVDDLLVYKGNKIFAIEQNTNIENLKSFFLQIKKTNTKYILLLPKKFEKAKVTSPYKKIFYPIHINNLTERIKKNFEEKHIYFKDIFIDSNVVNLVNSIKKIYFTETELNILNLLIVEKEVPKKEIKIRILNLQTSLETKSLESHLSRIRKKLLQIDSRINIITNEAQKVIIT